MERLWTGPVMHIHQLIYNNIRFIFHVSFHEASRCSIRAMSLTRVAHAITCNHGLQEASPSRNSSSISSSPPQQRLTASPKGVDASIVDTKAPNFRSNCFFDQSF
ncbi:hypothetical protein F2Q68_00008746 [Brassica cretica]|uniref:Uncharacterized protein n=1 Tax=Brassica cretica TaxID=69181 RepID=A0A8S9KY60_BRACR|nr:hypothetical protein F2Q68_00008746 [Brassica cretica]